MINRIQDLTTQATTLAASTLAEVEALRIKYLSKKGIITELFNDFRNVPKSKNARLDRRSMPCVKPTKRASTNCEKHSKPTELTRLLKS